LSLTPSIILPRLVFTLHSLRNLAYDMSTASSKRNLDRERSSDFSFNLQNIFVSLRSFSSCLRLFSRIFVTSLLHSIFPSINCFSRQFLRKMCPIQLAFLLCTAYRIFLLCVTPFNASLFFTCLVHPSFFDTTLQNLRGISFLLSNVFSFQHHKNLYS
jgi:hypothetical protein